MNFQLQGTSKTYVSDVRVFSGWRKAANSLTPSSSRHSARSRQSGSKLTKM